ncbi:MAG TPA: helix-turn-helix transcriptional regulator [Pirellulales bacterium]|nr:helix-turn-helix transcriptional regulator [Pirellulales bacterium]
MEKLELTKVEVRRGMAPLRSFHDQLGEQIHSYERLRRGDRKELASYHNLGQLLIAMRIASGLSQRELADRLDVHESQVSRDERNDYHGVTVERANRTIEALGFELRHSVVARKGRRAAQDRHAQTA